MAESYEDILYTQHGSVGIVTLNRPERLNAWTIAMERSVKRAILAAGRDDAVRVIIVTGAGRGFCAGADMQLLKGVAASTGLPSSHEAEHVPAVDLDAELSTPYPGRFGYLLSVGKPIVAAVNGPCAGIGFVFSLFCDFRFASEQAIFTSVFAKRGLIAEHGCSWLLPRLVGPARALDLMLSARRVHAAEAAAIGLVTDTFAHATFMTDVLTRVQALTQDVSPRSLAVIKAQLWKSLSQSLEVAVAAADREMVKSFASADFKEGVAHFVEKRAPRFTGR